MRRSDKFKNIVKLNLLTEERYLVDKGFINEMDVKPKREIIWRAPSKYSESGELLAKFGDRGEYLGREGSEEVVSFNRNFYTSEGTFEFVDKGHGSQEDFIKSIYGDGGLQEYDNPEDGYIPPDDGLEILDWEMNGDDIVFKTTRGNGRININQLEDLVGYGLSKDDVEHEIINLVSGVHGDYDLEY